MDNSASTESSSAIAELRERVAILERDLKTNQDDHESRAETLKTAQQALLLAEKAQNAVSDFDKKLQQQTEAEVEVIQPPPAPPPPETPVPQPPEPEPVPARTRQRTFFQKLF